MSTQPVSGGSSNNVSGTAGGSNTKSGTTASSTADPLTDKQTFITLLVAQLKNQDPLNPTDGVQFLSQLTEISSVEQLVDIRQDTDAIEGAMTTSASTGSSTSTTNNTSGNTSGTQQP